MRRTLLLIIAATTALPLPLHAQAPQPPQWLQQINPADYALLAGDLAEGLTFEGEITADARAVELGVTDAQGRTAVQQSFIFTLAQTIGVPAGEDAGLVSVYVAVFATPDECIAFTREHFGDYGGNPDWMVNANELGDRRIPAHGGSVTGAGRAIIRYRNIVGSFSWNGRIDDFGTQKTAQVAKLWLNKVAGPAGADLYVQPDYIILKHWSNDPQVEREAAADRQYVMAWVFNKSADLTARNVEVALSVRLENEQEYVPIGAPARIASIAPGGTAKAVFEWNLNGENVVNADLRLVVNAEGPPDADPRDNETHRQVSIYYAHNGTHAYRWLEDSYQFDNYTQSETDTVELVKGLLATVIGQMYTEPQAGELLNHLLFPQTYMRFFEYMQTSINAGSGGHCYGMAATAGLYFEDRSLSPSGAATWNLSPEVADPNIKLYQRAQMLPIARALVGDSNLFEINWGGLECLNMVRQMLRARTPAKIVFGGHKKVSEQVVVDGQPQQQLVDRVWLHAVLAYKLVEIQGGNSIIYVYDPNIPPMQQWNSAAPMSAILVSPQTGGLNTTSEMKAIYQREANDPGGEMSLKWLSAGPIDREISVAESNLVMPELRAKLKEMATFLENAKRVMAILSCPADVVFTDSQGRRVGEVGGQRINEVPGAQIRTSGEVEIYLLPSGQTYSVAITGTGAGEATFGIIRGAAGEPSISAFTGIPVSAGSSASGTLKPQGAIEALSVGGTVRAPSIVGSLAGEQVTWQEPTGPATVTPPPVTPPPTTPAPPTTTGAPGVTLVICTSQDNGTPIGAADSFVRPRELYGVLNFENQPAMTWTRVWLRNGQEINRGETQIEGTGWAWGSLTSNVAEGLEAGNWEMVWLAGDRLLARRTFTITERGAQAPHVTPAPVATQAPPATETWSFSDPSGSRQADMTLPLAGGELTLEFRYTRPGTLLDTVGILAAPDGSFCLTIFEDSTVTWQIMNRGTPSGIQHGTGWHYMTGQAALEPGRWHSASVAWGPGGMRLSVDGDLIGFDPVVLSLAQMPCYFGDLPTDGRPMGFVGEIRNVQVTAWQGGEG